MPARDDDAPRMFGWTGLGFALLTLVAAVLCCYGLNGAAAFVIREIQQL